MVIYKKKIYIKPDVVRILLDNSISLVMLTVAPPNPRPRGIGDSKNDPFQSPFSDKPFS
jgi:hypothetical protein